MRNFNNYKAKILDLMNSPLDVVHKLIKINLLALEHLKEFNPALEYDLQKHYSALYDKVKGFHMDLMTKCFFDNICEGKSKGIYRNNIDTSVAAKLQLTRIDNTIHSTIFSIGELTSPAFSREICFTQLKGIISETGQALLDKHISEIYDRKK